MVERNTTLLGMDLPLLAFSFSSKGFVNFPEIVDAYIARVPDAYLLSLYDYRYLLSSRLHKESHDARIRIWDSGGYETSKGDDLSSHFSAIRGDSAWTEDLYVEVASTIAWKEQDILVSFDSYKNRKDISIADQLESACRLFERIPGSYLRDVLLHVDLRVSPEKVAEVVAGFEGCFDIIGFTEKGIAPTWFQGIRFVSGVRTALNDSLGVYVPLHIFGCFDPKTITRFFFAGSDIFDGLSWLRYLILDGYTYYVREYEHFVHQSQHAQLGDYRSEIVSHNIAELMKLRNDLIYCVNSCDYAGYENEVAYVDLVVSQERS